VAGFLSQYTMEEAHRRVLKIANEKIQVKRIAETAH